jgi:hypothetical protein
LDAHFPLEAGYHRTRTHAARNTVFIIGITSMISRAELDLSTHDLSFTKVAETSEIPNGKMKMVKV